MDVNVEGAERTGVRAVGGRADGVSGERGAGIIENC